VTDARQALAAHHGIRPLSPAQRGLWFLENFHPNSSFYVVGFGLLLTGPLDVDALDGALRACVRRHEVLRTRFVTLDGHPYQVFTSDDPSSLTPVDLSGKPAHTAMAELRQRFDALAGRPFDLTAETPLRAELIRLAADRHALLLAIHHIVFDAWSSGLLLSELAAGYSALARGERYEPAPPRPSFGEVAQWQAADGLADGAVGQAVAHWRRLLADAPRLELPTDLARPRRRGFTGAVTAVDVDAGTGQSVRRLAGQLNVSPFIVLAAAFSLLLAQWSGQSDLVIGVPLAGRAHPDTHELIGFFTNTLPMRVDLTGIGSFREAVRRLRGPALDLLSHQDLPFPLLVEELGPARAGNRNPFYDVTFQHLPAPEAGVRFAGLTMELLSSDWHTAQFDLSCDVLDVGEAFRVQCEFSTELFSMTTIRGQLSRYVALLREAVADPGRLPRPRAAPGSGPRSGVLEAWADGGLAGLVSARAARTPDAVALRYRNASLSFSALDRAAGLLAGALAAAGVRPGDRVGLLLEPALEVPAAILAVVRLGAAYVPVDPRTPPQRAAALLRSAGCRAVVGHQHVPGAAGLDVTLIDPGSPGSATGPGPVAVSPGAAAYVMFTSGSTGQPKPVVVPHRAALSLAAAAASVYQLTPADVVAQMSSLAVDVSVEELFASWYAGASVALAPASLAALTDPGMLVREYGVTVLNLAAPLWHGWVRSLAAAGERVPGGVRLVVTGSDRLDPDLVRAWHDGPGRGIRLLNAYGTTETAVSSAWYDTAAFPVDARHTRTVPIGVAFPHACLHVLDDRLDPVPDGVPGELYVGGPGVALGYLGQPGATAARFVPDSCGAPDRRMYRTGDRVRRLSAGALEFIGRTDDQVQVHGYRIELGEVESAAAAVPGVAEFVAAARPDAGGTIRLLGYVRAAFDAVAESDASARVEEWRAVHDAELFNKAPPGTDPTLHTGGWLSSYTMAPVPAADMREWRCATVARLLADDLEHVVEIGCGTGMILLQIAPRAKSYLGTDISPRALEYVCAQLAALGLADGRVRLVEAAADDLTVLDGISPDLIVLNSVIQYFPGAGYLEQVLTAAWHRLRPGGRLFVGDVRGLRSLRLFHLSVLAARASGDASSATLAETAAERADTDGELCVDPRYFHALAGDLPDLAAVDVQVKQGRADTEMNRYRYDVTLWRAPVPAPVVTGLPVRDGSGLDAAATDALFAELDGAGAVLTGIPDARVAADLSLAGLSPAAVGAPGAPPGVHPDDIREIAARVGYAAAVRPSGLGRLEVTLLPEPGRPDLAAPDLAAGVADRAALTNDPMRASRQRQLADALYTRLRAVLPGPMVPGQLVFVPDMPRTASGKVDRGRLPGPPASLDRAVRIAPRTELERLLCAAWERALGVEAVGIRDNFFAVGGDSLTWLHLVSRLNRLGVRCEVREIFDHQTVEELARAISARREGGGEP
jgi:amino acid adenylation domain-containing protein